MRPQDHGRAGRVVHYWCSGQDDNLGDVVLRRRMLASLQATTRVVVHVGRATPGFVAGLEPSPDAVIVRDYRRFLQSALVSAWRGGGFAFDPGEIRCSRRQTLMHLLLLPVLVVSRLRRAPVLRIGVGTRDFTPVYGRLIRSTTHFGPNIWRDEFSRRAFGRGTVEPDWAFGETPRAPQDSPRDLIGVTLRSDRPAPSDAWIAAVREVAARTSSELVVVTQVRRDDPTDRELARRLGARHLGWPDATSHVQQEQAVRAAYARCRLVVSDRLHVLVMALTEGATPAGVVEHQNAKVERHFAVVDLAFVSRDVSAAATGETVAAFEAILAREVEVATRAAAARERVRALDDLVAAAVGPHRGRTVAPLESMDYLVSGLRVSLGADSATPGPRTHIVNMVEQFEALLPDVRLVLASETPLLSRPTTVGQADYQDAGAAKVMVADGLRVAAALLAGGHLAWTSRRRRPDVVYERSAVLQSFSSFHPGRRRALRVLEVNGILSRETAVDRNILRAVRLAAAVERHAIRSADVVVCVSENLREEIIAFAGIPADRVLVVPNGVRAEFATTARAPGTGPLRFGFAGSLSTWQGLGRVVEAFAAVSDAERVRHGWRFDVVGDGIELQRLRALTTELGLADRITFHGRLDPAATLTEMLRWDVGISAHQRSSSERMYHSPLKLYEYAAAGLDIVCSRSDDAASLAASGTRIEFFDDAAGLAQALRTSIDRGRRTPDQILVQRSTALRDHGWASRAEALVAELAARRAGRTRT